MPKHTTFTSGPTAYLQNLAPADLSADCFAVHYQKAPERTEHGLIISLRFPLLLVCDYCENQEEIAQKAARILEKHWNDPEDETQAAALEVANG